MRTFIAAIGAADNPTLSSFVRERLAGDAPMTAARVVLEELAADAADVADRLNAEWPQFERVILVGSVARARPAGTLSAYRWDGQSPNEERDPAIDGQGTPSFDSTLLALKELADLPDDVIVVEIEPHDEDEAAASMHDGSTLDRAQILVRRLATSAQAGAALPRKTLGGL
jgi:hypothetical protein